MKSKWILSALLGVVFSVRCAQAESIATAVSFHLDPQWQVMDPAFAQAMQQFAEKLLVTEGAQSTPFDDNARFRLHILNGDFGEAINT